MAEQQFPVPARPRLRVELKSGTSDLDALGHFGGKVSLGFFDCLTVFYFNGYGKEPSSYHLRSEYVGIGLEVR